MPPTIRMSSGNLAFSLKRDRLANREILLHCEGMGRPVALTSGKGHTVLRLHLLLLILLFCGVQPNTSVFLPHILSYEALCAFRNTDLNSALSRFVVSAVPCDPSRWSRPQTVPFPRNVARFRDFVSRSLGYVLTKMQDLP